MAKIADKFADPMDRKSRNGYSFLQDMGGGKLHLGFDFNKGWGDQDLGLQINATASGRIVYSKDSKLTPSYGNQIIIEHELPDGSKFYSRYAHLKKRWIAEGQDIGIGQGIGECGKSGGWKYAHLHLEIFTKEYWEQFASKKPFFYPSNWSRDKILRYFCNPLQFIDEHKEIKTDEEPAAELSELKTKARKYDELLGKLAEKLDAKPNEGDIESKIEGLLTKEDKIPEIKKETKVAVAKPQELIDSLSNLIKSPDKTEKALRGRLTALLNLEITKEVWEQKLKEKEEVVTEKIKRLKKIRKLREEGGDQMDYPRIRKIVWRLVRIFADAAVSALLVETALPASLEGWKVLIIISLTAGIGAAGKAGREAIGRDYKHILHRLPIG